MEVVSGGTNRYEVRLQPAAAIHGTIRRRDGRPLDDARVTLLDSALDERRREADDELLAELADLDPSAVSVLVSMARVLRERWPRPKGA